MTEWIARLTALDLFEPAWLLVLLFVPAALLLGRRRTPVAVVFADETAEPLPRTWRARLVVLPTVLWVTGLVLLAVALARPVRRDRVPLETEGIDIVLALDVSSSMSADDMDAARERLEVAKDAAAEFVRGRPHDRIGLVTFARFPEVRCPPTLDHTALASILASASAVESDSREDATAIGAAAARAAEVLRGAGRSRVIILLTDGAENVAVKRTAGEITPLDAAQLCRELGIRAYAIAVGTGDPGANGRVPSDTHALRGLAERTGARFYEARDAAAVSGVYADIDALERAPLEEPRFRVEERFGAWAMAAAALVVTAAVLRRTTLQVLP